MKRKATNRNLFLNSRQIALSLIVYTLLFTLTIGYSYAQSVEVPIDHYDLDKGVFNLEYEYGYPFDPNLPTIIIVADAQQFYVGRGRIQKIQDELFGDHFNILGIIPRGSNEELMAKFNTDQDVIDWDYAHQIFQSYQFIHDIQAIVKEVLKDQEEIYMYGQSGGAFLITEYLSLFPESKVKKVFIGASVNPIIESNLGVNHDNFQRNFLDNNPTSQMQLNHLFEKNIFPRKLVASLFQRQNFFVELVELEAMRTELMNHLYQKDTAYISALRNTYQIDALNQYLESKSGIPIRVRISEFINPLINNLEDSTDSFNPDLENSYHIAKPVVFDYEGKRRHIIDRFNEYRFSEYDGQIFILSARYDHVADYRSSIYLAGLAPNGKLFIVNDDHTFKSLKADGAYMKIVQNFFLNETFNWLTNFDNHRWIER